jgi:hypothetical protein
MSSVTHLAAGVARVAAAAAAVDLSPSGFVLLPILVGSDDVPSLPPLGMGDSGSTSLAACRSQPPAHK